MRNLNDYINELRAVREAEEEEKEKKQAEDAAETSEEDSKDDSEQDSDGEETGSEEDAVDMNGFMVLKPEFLDKEPDLRQRLEEEGWKVVGEQEKKLSEKEVKAFYDNKKNEPYFNDLVKYMTSGKSKCFMLWKEDSDDPIGELQTLKEKLRTEWSDDEMKNAIHSSDDFDAMEKELSIFLAEEEKSEEEDSKEKSDDDTEDENLLGDDEGSEETDDDTGDDNDDNETESDEEENLL